MGDNDEREFELDKIDYEAHHKFYTEALKGELTLAGVYTASISAFLALTIVFIDNVIPENQPLINKWALLLSWLAFLIALFFSLRYIRKVLDLGYNRARAYQTRPSNEGQAGTSETSRLETEALSLISSGRCTFDWLNFLLIAGIALLVAFVWTNLSHYR